MAISDSQKYLENLDLVKNVEFLPREVFPLLISPLFLISKKCETPSKENKQFKETKTWISIIA